MSTSLSHIIKVTVTNNTLRKRKVALFKKFPVTGDGVDISIEIGAEKPLTHYQLYQQLIGHEVLINGAKFRLSDQKYINKALELFDAKAPNINKHRIYSLRELAIRLGERNNLCELEDSSFSFNLDVALQNHILIDLDKQEKFTCIFLISQIRTL